MSDLDVAGLQADGGDGGYVVASTVLSNSAAASINCSNVVVSPKNIGPSISR